MGFSLSILAHAAVECSSMGSSRILLPFGLNKASFTPFLFSMEKNPLSYKRYIR